MTQTKLYRHGLLVFCLLAAGALCALVPAFGQAVSTSQITGTVTDSSGAALVSAQVVLTNTNTARVHKVVTNSTGGYVIPDLPAGAYTLQVTAPGFQTYMQKGIQISVGVNPQFNVKMNVGAVTQQVVVQSNSAQVETSSTGVGEVIDQAQVVNLPLNGRDPDQLIQLAGAATTAPGGDLNSNKNFPTVTISVAGGLLNGIQFVLDGGAHNEPTNGLNLPQPMPDSLQEFKVETSALPAQFGDHASAVINAITKSGTNAFHGDAFDFFRNYLFNAQNFFSSSALTPHKDGLKRNQFGGTLGGPIIKNKLFFFGGLEVSIVRATPTASYTQVPTTAMMNGDFSTVTSAACNASPIALGAPFTTINGVPNQLPSGDFSSPALAATKFIPIAGTNAPDVTSIATKGRYSADCGYVRVAIPENSRQDNAIGRVDYTLSAKNSLFARYFLGINDQPIAPSSNALNVQAVDQYNRDQGITAGDTYIFTQNLINSLRLTANRVVNLRSVQPFFDPSDLGIDQYNALPGFMGLSVTNGFGVGGGATNPGHFNSTTWQFVDDVNYIHGNHELGFGVDYSYALMDTVNVRPSNGIYTFTGQELSTQGGKTGSYGYGDFFAGNVDSFEQGLPDLENDGQQRIGVYAQDSWKVKNNFTINYGARWEPYLPEHNSNDHVEAFSMDNFTNGVTSRVYTAAPAGMIFDGDPGMSGDHYNFASYDIVDPRFGLIWVPFGDGKTSVRAGYGIFHDSPQMFFNTRYSNQPPFGDAISINNVPFASPWTGYPGGNPFPGLDTISKTRPFPTAGVYVFTPLHIKVMTLEQWNLSVQRQLGNWLLSGSYLGNRTVHLETAYEANPALYIPGTSTGQAGSCGSLSGSNLPKAGSPCSSTGNYNPRRLLYQQNPTQGAFYATMGTYDPGGVANYNGMLLSVQRRTKNFTILANYTYAHCLSEAETTELTGPSYQLAPAIVPNARGYSYSNCDSDHRQVANVSMVLTSPGVGSHFVKMLTTDWRLAPIFTASTGGYSSVLTGADNALAGTTTSGIAYNSPTPYGKRTNFGVDEYLNKSGWTAPPTGSFSLQRPLTIVGPSTYQLDMALSRTFPVYHTESQRVEARWEVFNVPNEAILGGAGSTTTEGFGAGVGGGFTNSLTSPTFGNFTTAGNPRIMQFALKYLF